LGTRELGSAGEEEKTGAIKIDTTACPEAIIDQIMSASSYRCTYLNDTEVLGL